MIVNEVGGSSAHTTSSLPFIATVASTAVGLLLIGVMLAYTGYGYDFTDEGFYLVRISNPFADAPAVSQFGIIFYPFYRLFDGNIAGLRQLNLLAIFSSSIFLCVIAIREQCRLLTGTTLLLVSLGVASTSLMAVVWFLVTPNYNSLALLGLVLTTIGLVLAQRQAHPSSIAGWLLIGFGGWLAFLAKPPSAAMLAVLSLTYLAVTRKLRLRLVLLAIGFAALLVLGTMFAIDGSVMGFVERIQRGIERVLLLGDHSRTFRLDRFAPTRIEKLLIGGLAIWTFMVLRLTAAGSARTRTSGLAMAVVAGVVGALILLGNIAVPLQRSFTQQEIAYGPILGLLTFLSLEWFTQRHRKHDAVPPTSPRWPLIALLTLLPLSYSFGTGTNYWNASAAAGLFWGIAGCVLLLRGQDQARETAMLPAWVLVLQLSTAILLAAGLQWPYRQPQPVRSFDGFTKIGARETELIMPRDFAIYLDKMRDILDTHGFTRGNPIIDLSGQSPGVLFALGAQNIGQPWMIGGYPGSTKLALKVLQHVNCEALVPSWILVEPNGPRAISTDVLEASGLPFPGSYESVGEIMTPAGAGGYTEPRRQIIYKPIEPAANIASACRAHRG